MSGRHDAAELARSLLGEMPPAQRAEFLTDELLKINGLEAAATARNRLTDHCFDLIAERYGEDAA